MKNLILSILAAIAINFIVATVIDTILHMTGVYPPFGQAYFDTDLFLLALGYRFIITIYAAYVTAKIAKEKAKTAIYFTGILGTLMWTGGGIAMRGMGPDWYSVVGAITSLPLALIGWEIYKRRNRTEPA